MEIFNENNQQKFIIVVYIENIYQNLFARFWRYRVLVYSWEPDNLCDVPYFVNIQWTTSYFGFTDKGMIV